MQSYMTFFLHLRRDKMGDSMKWIIIICLALMLIGCSQREMSIRYSEGPPPAPYGKPDKVDHFQDANYVSVTYTYVCLQRSEEFLKFVGADPSLHHKYVSITYTRNYGNFSGWETSTYVSTGLCD